MSRVLEALSRWAVERGETVALSDDSLSLTYADLDRAVDETAADLDALLRGTPATAPVAIALSNCPAWVVLDLALVKLGRPSVPLPAFFTADQQSHAEQSAGAVLRLSAADGAADLTLLGTRLRATLLDNRPQSLPGGVAKITYTSGSTGAPKGVCLSQSQMEAVSASIVEVLGADMAGRHMPLLPLAVLLENVAGLYPILMAGGEYRVLRPEALGLADSFRPDLLAMTRAIADNQATSLILVPELLRALLFAMSLTGVRLEALRMVAVGGAKVAPSLLQQALAAGLPVCEGYGLSECASVVALNTPMSQKLGAVGRPLPHLDVRVDADGEIVVGPRPFLGYAGEPPRFGPVLTGDLGSLDADGFLHVTGRRAATIITGFGRNISPEWVESELLAQPEIRQALVFGEAERSLGALIVPLTPEISGSAIGAAVARANAKLPAYAQVERWRLRPPFEAARGELTGNGRLRRAEILAHLPDVANVAEQEPPMSFFERLVAETAAGQARLASVPQIQDGLVGRITRETYVAYLTEAHHHVRHTVPLMQAARARLDADHARFREALDAYIEEETGHEAWILDDIAACGSDREAARLATPRPATQAMVDFAYRYIADVNPMGFFGMVFVLEGTSVRLATQGASAVAKTLGLGPECFRYLTSHGALDLDHMAYFQKLMGEVTDPADQAAIIEMANVMFGLFADVFAAIPHSREPVHV